MTSKRIHSLSGMPMTALGRLPLAAGLAALLVALAAVWGGGSHRTALADVLPANCGPTVGTAAASIRIQSVPANPADGDILAYKVGASYPAPAHGVGCTVFDVDVFIRKPNSDVYLFACNIPALASGSATVECPGSVRYTISAADRTADGDLIASVHVMGNKHDRADDCTFGTSPRDPTKLDPCFDASAISRLLEANTPTPTPVPTETPVPPPAPETGGGSETGGSSDTNVVLAATQTHSGGVGTPLGEITLPSTGTPPSGPSSTWIIAALALAAGGMALASQGRLIGNSRRARRQRATAKDS